MKEYIKSIVEILRKGGIILYPTDTVWGIGCDATNPEAIKKVLEIKQITDSKPLIVLASNLDMIAKYTDKVPDVAWELVEVTDSPLTVIYPKSIILPEILSAEDGSIGIRLMKSEKSDFCKILINTLGKPIVSTSANINGEATPITFDDISEEISEAVDFVVDKKYARGMTNKASSIVKVGSRGEIKIIRK